MYLQEVKMVSPTGRGAGGPPSGFPANPPGVPSDWRPVGDSKGPNGSYNVVYQTGQGTYSTYNTGTGVSQPGAN
jgi:hypothetical protein